MRERTITPKAKINVFLIFFSALRRLFRGSSIMILGYEANIAASLNSNYFQILTHYMSARIFFFYLNTHRFMVIATIFIKEAATFP